MYINAWPYILDWITLDFSILTIYYLRWPPSTISDRLIALKNAVHLRQSRFCWFAFDVSMLTIEKKLSAFKNSLQDFQEEAEGWKTNWSIVFWGDNRVRQSVSQSYAGFKLMHMFCRELETQKDTISTKTLKRTVLSCFQCNRLLMTNIFSIFSISKNLFFTSLRLWVESIWCKMDSLHRMEHRLDGIIA